jgi:hypothetical protein
MFQSIWKLEEKYFKRTKLALINIANWVISEWEKRLMSDVSPRWWGRMAVSNGHISYVRTPYGIRVFYVSKSQYDYMDVVENGRSAYDIKKAFSKSDRVRRKKNGGWYIVIPMTTNKEDDGSVSKVNAKNNDINATMKKIGEYKDNSGQLRGRYEYTQGKGTTGKGNAFRFPQQTKRGITYSYAKFITASDRSSGWIYPAIQPNRIAEKLEKDAGKLMGSAKFRQAVERDTEQYIQTELKKLKS